MPLQHVRLDATSGCPFQRVCFAVNAPGLAESNLGVQGSSPGMPLSGAAAAVSAAPSVVGSPPMSFLSRPRPLTHASPYKAASVQRFQTRPRAMAPRSRPAAAQAASDSSTATTIADLLVDVLARCLGFLCLEERCVACLWRCLP